MMAVIGEARPAVPPATERLTLPATPMPVLESRRVRLRPFTGADITEAYIGWLNDPEVVRYSNQRFVRHTRASCERYLAGFAGGANLFASLRLRLADGRDTAVGTMTAYRSLVHGTADVGILLGERSVWGQAIGLEAWCLMTDWLLTTPGLRKVTAGTLACNRSMLAVAEMSGMHREGTRRDQELVDGVPTDVVHFARFRRPGTR
jgi:RimJ/RimL family protein N-acetyltransferase